MAFAVRAAGAGRYTQALAKLDARVAALAHRRASQAQARIDSGTMPPLAEFDLIYGLTGIGAYLLRSDPGGSGLEHVLRYLVRLTEPLRDDGQMLPGWWTSHDPSFKHSPGFAGGHANFGIAHGIAGPLALLALAPATASPWTARTRPSGGSAPGWMPGGKITAPDHGGRSGSPAPTCAPGIRPSPARCGRAGATAPPAWPVPSSSPDRAGETMRQDTAEHALAGCLSDPGQFARITDASMCHGWAGVFQAAWHAARDARTPAIANSLAHLASQVTEHGRPGAGDGTGFLVGDAGLALVLHSIACGAPPATGWDACLLIC